MDPLEFHWSGELVNTVEQNIDLNEDEFRNYDIDEIVKNLIFDEKQDNVENRANETNERNKEPDQSHRQRANEENVSFMNPSKKNASYISQRHYSFNYPHQVKAALHSFSGNPAVHQHLNFVEEQEKAISSLPTLDITKTFPAFLNDNGETSNSNSSVRDNIESLPTKLYKQNDQQFHIGGESKSASNVDGQYKILGKGISMLNYLPENQNFEILHPTNVIQVPTVSYSNERQRNIENYGSYNYSFGYDPLEGTSTMHTQALPEKPTENNYSEIHFNPYINVNTSFIKDDATNRKFIKKASDFATDGTTTMNVEAQREGELKPTKPHFSGAEYRNRFVSDTKFEINYEIHTGENTYICNVCNKGFKDKCRLTRHSHTHNGEKLFVCKQCGKFFSRTSNLKQHSMIYNDEKPFICNVCQKGFKKKVYLTKHMRIHTGEKPYSCSKCDRCFATQYHLARHIRIHTGEKPYMCPICGRAFSRSSNCKRHRKNVHN